jgi:hypothetical protein
MALSGRLVMRFKMRMIQSDRKPVRRSDRQAGRATTFVLIGVAVVAVAGLVFAVMKVTGPEDTQLASYRPGDASGQAGAGLAASGAAAGSAHGGASGGPMGSSGAGAAGDRNVVGGRSDAFSSDAAGGSGVFGPDGRLRQERPTGNGNQDSKTDGKVGVGGTGYGTSAGGRSVLGKYAPPPPPPVEDIPTEARSPGENSHGVEPAPDLGLDPDTVIVGIGTNLTDVKPATTTRQLLNHLNELANLPNPPEKVVLHTWDPYPPGGQGMTEMPLQDAINMLRKK